MAAVGMVTGGRHAAAAAVTVLEARHLTDSALSRTSLFPTATVQVGCKRAILTASSTVVYIIYTLLVLTLYMIYRITDR